MSDDTLTSEQLKLALCIETLTEIACFGDVAAEATLKATGRFNHFDDAPSVQAARECLQRIGAHP